VTKTNLYILLTLLSVIYFSFGYGQHNYDTLFLQNGQVVFGELKSISLGKVKFDMKDLTITDIKMNKIKTISATSRLFRIETVNKQVFYSKLNPSKKDGYVLVGDSSGGAEVPLDYLSIVYYYNAEKNIFEGNLSMGYNYTKSSDIGRFNLDATMSYIMKKFTLKNTISTIVTQENKQWIRDRESITLSGTYFANSKWKAIGLLNYQLNRELGLEYRFQEGLGVGYNIISTSQMRFFAISGIVINQEKSFEASVSNFTSEIPLVIDFEFFRFAKPEMSLSLNNSLFKSITQKDRIRLDGEIRYDWKVITDFSLNLKFYYNFDNQPLSGTGSTFDYGTVFGIAYKWK
jgi:hypothetical protein